MTHAQAIRKLAQALVVCAMVTACGGGGVDTVMPLTVGPAGGTVASAEGASVTIPAGALAAQVAVAVAKDSTGAPALPQGVQAAGDVFAFTPHGTAFAVPAALSVPFDTTRVQMGATLVLMKTNAALTGWAPVAGATFSGSKMSGSASSFSFVVVVAALSPTITQGPADQTVAVGQSATFSAVASANPAPAPLLYAWQSSTDGGATWTTIAGATNASYTTPAATAGDDGTRFRVNVGLQVLPWVNIDSAAATLIIGGRGNGLSLLAGDIGGPGSLDGTGGAARFYDPAGIAADVAGNLYVADGFNHTIRKITPAGVVSTLAGSAGNPGSADGTGGAARFSYPNGVAVDASGNVYVADESNQTIRKVTPAGVVSTLAGLAGFTGSTDGTGNAARFTDPNSVAVDGAGNVYVSDNYNFTIRKITPAGVVSTLAGSVGSCGSADGTGDAARFCGPAGVAVDAAGNVYVADFDNQTIRKITPAGVVSTLAGLAGNVGSTDGTGSAARFKNPLGVAVDAAGNLYVTDTTNETIRKVTPAGTVSTVVGVAGEAGIRLGIDGRLLSPQGVAVIGANRLAIISANTVLLADLP